MARCRIRLAVDSPRPRRGAGNSSGVLAELAERIPAFAAAKGGKVAAFGVLIGEAQPPSGRAPSGPSFNDAWFVAHGAARWR